MAELSAPASGGNTIIRFAHHIRRLSGAFTGTFLSAFLALGGAAAESETAAIAPMHGPSTSEAAPPPSILNADDRALYRQIFDLQRDGHWDDADALISEISDPILIGHALFQRYMHPTKYRSKYFELKEWMAEYADHPGATRIYRLALKRRPANYKFPTEPRTVELPGIDTVDGLEEPVEDTTDTDESDSRKFAGKNRAQRRLIRAVQRQIRSLVQRGNVTIALNQLSTAENRKLFDPVSYAESLGIIARGYYRYHYDEKAMKAAADAAALVGDDAASAHWWGGLAAWRAGELDVAGTHFEQLSRSDEADDWLRSAGGLWASRAFLVGGQPARVSAMLRSAAEYPRTFYGLLSIRALGQTPPLDFEMPVLSAAESELLERIPAVRRAIALFEAGQADLADAELRRFVDDLPPSLATILLALADTTGMADVAYRLGLEIGKQQGLVLDGALYPLPGWRPVQGFSIDRALVFAIVRQESRFRVRAQSRAGARGLMQLMPATAGDMAGQRFRGTARAKLFDPSLNLELGQKYIQHILEQEDIDGNLLYALVAYNAGPGNLKKWRKKIDDTGDPLLFIESLPSRETRKYIEHVLSNFWIYRARLNQPVTSMDALIGSQWPIYVSHDGGRQQETAALTLSAE